MGDSDSATEVMRISEIGFQIIYACLYLDFDYSVSLARLARAAQAAGLILQRR